MAQDPTIAVIHVGPHPLTVGGTQSVMRTIAEFGLGADEISIRPTWDGPRHFANAVLVAAAARAIWRASTDTIIHVHLANGGAYLRDGPLIALARARGLRVVVSIHGFDFPQFSVAHRRFVRAILSNANGILCLSDEAVDAVDGLSVSAQVRRLANPVAIDEGAGPVRNTDAVVLFAGTVGRRKGADVLVAAWKILIDRGIQGTCKLVGPIDDYRPPEIHRMTVEGPADPLAMKELIRSARVVALPSRAEGMPMILTEAIAAGRPFVATAVGGTADLAPCQSMLVAVEDSRALADALERFLTDPEMAQRVGSRCQQLCAETRGPQVIGAALREFYESLIRV